MANDQFSPPWLDFDAIESDDHENEVRERQNHLYPTQEPHHAFPEDDHYRFGKALSPLFSPISDSYLPSDEYLRSCFPAPAKPFPEIRKLENIFNKSGKESRDPGLSLSSSLEILTSYGSGLKKLNISQSLAGSSNVAEDRRKLSAEEIMRVAGARYIQLSHQCYDDYSMLMHPFGYALTGLSEEEIRDVELAHLLLAAAEKVGRQQFDRANRLLTRCEWVASEKANPVQRVVLCFAEALRVRINRATGNFAAKEVKCKSPNGLVGSFAALSYHQKIPTNQVMQLVAIQSIIENIGSATKLHVIDLQIRSGIQWTALMQALAERTDPPIKSVRVTAIGRLAQKDWIEETGKRLEDFAKSMNFPFTFKVVYLSCWNDIKYEQFDIAADESVVVEANTILKTVISKPECLEHLMRVIRSFNPSIMVVAEVEANHNSPLFVNRFVEGLFYASANFDCFDTCMDQNSKEHRTELEASFAHGINNMIVMEGKERMTRSVKIAVWRAFFSTFRMIELGISESSLYQADLVIKQFPFGNFCTLENDGKCLIIGWKGTPILSLSIWKFSRDGLSSCS